MRPAQNFALYLILCIFTMHEVESNTENVGIAEISASTFRYIAKNIVNGYLPAIGNAEVFSGKQLFERPPQREMNNVEDRNRREEQFGS